MSTQLAFIHNRIVTHNKVQMDDGIDGCLFTLAILEGVLCDIGCDFLASIYEGYGTSYK